VHLVVVGDGQLRKNLEAQAHSPWVLPHAVTVPRIASPEKKCSMSCAAPTLFLIPSRTEGLPSRGSSEAMAVGVPATRQSCRAGIPELLEPEEMVPPGEVTALAKLHLVVLGDPARRSKMSERNRHQGDGSSARAYCVISAPRTTVTSAN